LIQRMESGFHGSVTFISDARVDLANPVHTFLLVLFVTKMFLSV